MNVDLSRSLRSLVDGAMDRARHLQARREWSDAAAAWDQAAWHVLEYSRTAGTDDERKRRVNAAADFRSLAERLRSAETSASAGPLTANLDSGGRETSLDEPDEYATAVNHLIHKSSIRFDEIAGLTSTKRAIQAAFALSLAIPPTGIQLPPVKNILFYGPAGCGKTLLAAAASNGLDATFFNVKVGDLMSKWFGESPRLVQALYRQARGASPGVVFLDEVDALLADRDGSDSGSERRVLVSFLSELDGLREKSGDDYVLTIAATNTPWVLDKAILSRFERKVYIPLPDAPAREQILCRQLEERGFQLECSVQRLAERTDGMSGRELERIAKILIETMISRANPDLADIAMKGRQAIASWQMNVLPISERDIENALELVRPETSPELIEKFRAWGQCG